MEQNNKKTKNQEQVEEELLASSQELECTVIEASGLARSTPKARDVTKAISTGIKAGTSKNLTGSSNKPTSRSDVATTKSKKKGRTLKQKYIRAKYILEKIAKNKETGKVHERDLLDKIRFEAVVREYEDYLKSKPAEAPNQTVAEKRNRSQDETTPAASKKVKRNTTQLKYNEVVKSDLHVVLLDSITMSGKPIITFWAEVETKITELIMEKVALDSNANLSFDSSGMLRGCRAIVCGNLESRNFLGECVEKIKDTWEGICLKMIPAKEAPVRPKARIWIPKLATDGKELLRHLQLMNKDVPMQDWHVLKQEDTKKYSCCYLLLINEPSIKVLEQKNFHLLFGLRKARIKVLNREEVAEVNEEVESLIEQLEQIETGEDGDDENLSD
jgi:hypothetical protein